MGTRLLVCGGRNYGKTAEAYRFLDGLLERHGTIDIVIHGDAQGADRIADHWASDRGLAVKKFPADWKTHGRKAGYIRNRQMLDVGRPTVVVAFPGGRGTAMMTAIATAAGVQVIRSEVEVPLSPSTCT